MCGGGRGGGGGGGGGGEGESEQRGSDEEEFDSFNSTRELELDATDKTCVRVCVRAYVRACVPDSLAERQMSRLSPLVFGLIHSNISRIEATTVGDWATPLRSTRPSALHPQFFILTSSAVLLHKSSSWKRRSAPLLTPLSLLSALSPLSPLSLLSWLS